MEDKVSNSVMINLASLILCKMVSDDLLIFDEYIAISESASFNLWIILE